VRARTAERQPLGGMNYADSQYEVAVFLADATLADGITALERLAAVASSPLAVKGVRSPTTAEAKGFRKRPYSRRALEQFEEESGGDPSQSLFIFDPGWSKSVAPSVLLHWAQNTRRHNQGFLLAAFAAAVAPPVVSRIVRGLFDQLGGTSGGLVRCPYALPDGTSLEWAYLNNVDRDGNPKWRFPFSERWGVVSLPPN